MVLVHSLGQKDQDRVSQNIDDIFQLKKSRSIIQEWVQPVQDADFRRFLRKTSYILLDNSINN